MFGYYYYFCDGNRIKRVYWKHYFSPIPAHTFYQCKNWRYVKVIKTRSGYPGSYLLPQRTTEDTTEDHRGPQRTTEDHRGPKYALKTAYKWFTDLYLTSNRINTWIKIPNKKFKISKKKSKNEKKSKFCFHLIRVNMK